MDVTSSQRDQYDRRARAWRCRLRARDLVAAHRDHRVDAVCLQHRRDGPGTSATPPQAPGRGWPAAAPEAARLPPVGAAARAYRWRCTRRAAADHAAVPITAPRAGVSSRGAAIGHTHRPGSARRPGPAGARDSAHPWPLPAAPRRASGRADRGLGVRSGRPANARRHDLRIPAGPAAGEPGLHTDRGVLPRL